MSVKYAYYRDGLVPTFIVRRTYGDGKGVVEVWDYKNKKWVLNADGWDTVNDTVGHWRLPEEDVAGYIASMEERFPSIKDHSVPAKPDGAKRG